MPITTDEKTKVASADDAIEWLKGKLEIKRVPRHQHKGPIPWKSARAYVVCLACTRLFADKTRPRKRVGVSKQHFQAHLEAHKLGLVRKLT